MSNQKSTQTGSVGRPGFNYQMCVLSAIGICFVVLGHIKNDYTSIGTFYGWFPYYAFHMPLFLFITGYFFRDQFETRFFRAFGKFLWKKTKTLVLPFYLINSAFLVISLLLEPLGYVPEYHYGLLEWLISPFIYTQPVTFAIPTWYLMGLFFTEIFFILLRKAISLVLKKNLAREIAMLAVTLLIGMGAIWLRNTHQVSESALVYLRSAAMLFFIETGLVYRKYLERHDRLGNLPYLALVFFCEFLLLMISRGSALSPGLYRLVNFDHTGILYFLAGLTGIALWLRISRIIASAPVPSRCITFIGQHTRDIMSFHPFGFFLLNTLFYLATRLNIGRSFLEGFNSELYHTAIFYLYIDNPRFAILYFAAGIGFSLLMAFLLDNVRQRLTKKGPASR